MKIPVTHVIDIKTIFFQILQSLSTPRHPIIDAIMYQNTRHHIAEDSHFYRIQTVYDNNQGISLWT